MIKDHIKPHFLERFKVTSVLSFVLDFNLVSHELNNFTSKLLY